MSNVRWPYCKARLCPAVYLLVVVVAQIILPNIQLAMAQMNWRNGKQVAVAVAAIQKRQFLTTENLTI